MSKQYGKPISVDSAALGEDPRGWLANRMHQDMPWLLAHADDGVIWGKLQEDGTLLLSSDVFDDPIEYPSVAVLLRAVTLQQVRAFGPAGELLIWRTDDGFAGRLLNDDQIELEALPDEEHLLWHLGNPVRVDQRTGFALLQEGQQGQRHAPPVIPQGRRRPALTVRHYVDYDDEDQAYIALSRLLGLEV
jgi:CRISPR-associated protein (TIGR03984 family)